MDDLNQQQTGLELDDEPTAERPGGRTTNSGSYRPFDSDIRDTTEAFNSKIKEKKKERDRVQGVADKRSRIRQSYIVQAIVGMRKSLREVTRLDLGDRFAFMVTTDDWQGWPRVTLSVLDETVPDAEYPRFQIVGGYRDDKAQIDLNLGDPDNTLTYNLTSEADLRKLSGIFKKSVRSFLDMIGDVILQAERAPVERQIDQVKASLPDEDIHAPSADDGMALDSNIFDDHIEENLFEALPHLDEVDALPRRVGHEFFSAETKALEVIPRRNRTEATPFPPADPAPDPAPAPDPIPHPPLHPALHPHPPQDLVQVQEEDEE